jgi:hypothetical protein
VRSLNHITFFSHPEDFEDDGDEEVDKDSDSDEVKEEVGTPALVMISIFTPCRGRSFCLQKLSVNFKDLV